jgi:hypothetical protein
MELVNKLPTAGNLDDDWSDSIIIHALLREALTLNPNFETRLQTATVHQ